VLSGAELKWFAPLPWTTSQAQLDVRPGGSSIITMRSPDGAEFPNRGTFLEVVPNEKLVFTDAYARAREPLHVRQAQLPDLESGKCSFTSAAPAPLLITWRSLPKCAGRSIPVGNPFA
jgi:uncharacterized protein YndB with AHSA1/START domain